MSPELKLLMSLVLDCVAAGKSVANKQSFGLVTLPLIEKIVLELPGTISGAGAVHAELKDLLENKAGADADFVNFVASKFASNSEKAQEIIEAAGAVVIDVLALVAKIHA